jgi:hypothetical protein
MISLVLFLAGCAVSPEEKFLGDWERIEKSEYGEEEDWAKVTRTDDGLMWEDCNGKFPATLEAGELLIDVDGFPAMAIYDETSGILTYMVHGNPIQYKKKN